MSKHVWLPILVEAAKTLRATVAKTKGNKQKEKDTFVCRMSAKKKKKRHGGYESGVHGIRLVDLTPLLAVYVVQLWFENAWKF